jgi:rhomboid family GlyGly-CTERM serine protease
VADRARVTIALAVLCLLVCWADAPVAAALAWDREAIVHGEVWRLWTGHLVHFSISHAGADALALLAMGLLAEPSLGARRYGAVLFAGAAAISLGLLMCAPALVAYRGASGLAMQVAALAGTLAWRQRPALRPVVACAAGVLVAKLAREACNASDALASLPPGVAVAWQAHLLGAVAGIYSARMCLGPALQVSSASVTR